MKVVYTGDAVEILHIHHAARRAADPIAAPPVIRARKITG
jgi:hypothetical protein